MTHPIDDKTPSKEWSLVDKIKETKAVVHKESSETDEKNLNKEPEKQKVKKEKMKIVADNRGNHLLLYAGTVQDAKIWGCTTWGAPAP